MFEHLIPADSTLFFSKNDPDDLRFGDITLRRPEDLVDSVRVVMVGVPQHIGVERNGGRPGAEGGPESIRRMLYRLATYDVECERSIPEKFFFDAGDVHTGGSLEDIHERLENVVTTICRSGRIPLVIGGGHDITYPVVRGAYRHHGVLGAFNFDAHLDVRPPSPDRNSGTSFRMLIDEKILSPSRFVEFGIQPFANAKAHIDWLYEQGGRIRTLEMIRHIGITPALKAALALATSGHSSYYATLDLDGVKASSAPGVSATMPDGFESGDLLAAARMLGSDRHCVAFDIAEMNPIYDQDNITAKLAAHAVARFVVACAGR